MNKRIRLKFFIIHIGFIVFICSCKNTANENKSYPTNTKRVVFVDSIDKFSFLSVEKPKIETIEVFTTQGMIKFDEKDYSYTLGDIDFLVCFYTYPGDLNENEIIKEEVDKYTGFIYEKKEIEYKGVKGIEFSGYQTYLNNKKEFVYTTLTRRIIVDNKKVYSISVSKKNKSDKLVGRNVADFFNSFVLSNDSVSEANKYNNPTVKKNIHVTSLNDFTHLIETNFENIDEYLSLRNWNINQDDRNIGKGVVFKKEKGADYEQIVFYRNTIIYSTNKSIFSSITSEIKNNNKYFKTSVEEDGTKRQLYYNNKCRFGYNTSKKEIFIDAKK